MSAQAQLATRDEQVGAHARVVCHVLTHLPQPRRGLAARLHAGQDQLLHPLPRLYLRRLRQRREPRLALAPLSPPRPELRRPLACMAAVSQWLRFAFPRGHDEYSAV